MVVHLLLIGYPSAGWSVIPSMYKNECLTSFFGLAIEQASRVPFTDDERAVYKGERPLSSSSWSPSPKRGMSACLALEATLNLPNQTLKGHRCKRFINRSWRLSRSMHVDNGLQWPHSNKVIEPPFIFPLLRLTYKYVGLSGWIYSLKSVLLQTSL